VVVRTRRIRVCLVAALLGSLVSCAGSREAALLNPDRPLTVTLWHYYSGNIKETFDRLVAEFNETVGRDKGIVVDAQSPGDVNQLASAVFDAANGSLGSSPLPNLFASYPDNAFRVHQVTPLVDLSQEFTPGELARFRPEFLAEGRFVTDGRLYILPVAKSSENLYVNQEAWRAFAAGAGFTDADLATWEGLARVARRYHEATGKAFFGIDGNANFLLVAARQLGSELYRYSADGTAQFQLTPEVARALWNAAYLPYLRGDYVKTGRFSSDDAKAGTILAYTGSTAGAAYFPKTVALSETDQRPVVPLVLPYPRFAQGRAVAIQQGAGMCITRSDPAHELASALFLKWFTDPERNLKFALSTGYYPVSNEVLEGPRLEEAARHLDREPPAAVLASLAATATMFRDDTLYNSQAFVGSFEARAFLERALLTRWAADHQTLQNEVARGANRATVLARLGSDEACAAWAADLSRQVELILGAK